MNNRNVRYSEITLFVYSIHQSKTNKLMKKLLFLSSLFISGVLSAQAPYPYSQNFDAVTTSGTPATGTLPTGWTTSINTSFKVYGLENFAPHGQSPNNACTTEMNASHSLDTLITPVVGITANTKLGLAYRFVNKAGYPSTGYQLITGDQIKIDAYLGTSWTNVATINVTTNPTATSAYTTYTYNCTNCATLIGFGITSMKIRMDVARATSATSDWYLDVDNFQVADVLTGIFTNTSNPPSISVFPNPSHGNFSVSLKNYQPNNQVEVTVYNFLGQKVKTITAEGAVNNEINVNTTGLEKGMYLVEVKLGSEVAKTKVLID
jgi:hypothetical protein